MYLLSFDLSDPATLALLGVTATVIQCVVLYYVIKIAATDAGERAFRQAVIQNQLLAEGLKQQGVSEERLQQIFYPTSQAPTAPPVTTDKQSRDTQVANTL